jgi:hypothetical protein
MTPIYFWKKIFWLAAFLLVFLGLIFGGLFFLPINKSVYLGAVIDKEDFLKKQKTPSIILVGGSNVSLGLDGAKISSVVGRPTANLALHVSLGLRFMLNQTKRLLKEGDWVILSPEYEEFGPMVNGDGPQMAGLVAVNPASLKDLNSFQQFKNLFSNLDTLVKIEVQDLLASLLGRGNQCTDQVYCRSAFDVNGDDIGHLNLANRPFPPNPNLLPAIPGEETLGLLRDFVVFATERGVRVFYSFPPLVKSEFEKNRDSVLAVEEAVRKIPNLVVWGKPEDFAYSDESFFDTQYHLNGGAREKRTEIVIKTIFAELKNIK